MNNEVLFRLSYGLYLLSAKCANKTNGCIVNTIMQVTDEPRQVAITVNKENYTHDMLMQSREAVVSILSVSATFDTIKHFGFQSGKDVDKFNGIAYAVTEEGIPYLTKGCCAYFYCKVLDTVDLGTHTLFTAVVTKGDMLSTEAPLTYDDYHKRLKPKPQDLQESLRQNAGQAHGSPDKPEQSAEPKIIGWRCIVCGYIYEGPDLPPDFICPWCKHGAVDFEKIIG